MPVDLLPGSRSTRPRREVSTVPEHQTSCPRPDPRGGGQRPSQTPGRRRFAGAPGTLAVTTAFVIGIGLVTGAAGSPAQAAPYGLPPAAAVLPPVNAYAAIQCEDYDEQNGIRLEGHPGGLHAGFISTADWLRFDNVGFTGVPARRMTIRASNAARQNRTGRVELRLDDRSNAPIASMTIPNNGNWLEFITYEVSIPATVGTHTVFLTFTSTQDEEFANVDWITFRH